MKAILYVLILLVTLALLPVQLLAMAISPKFRRYCCNAARGEGLAGTNPLR